MLSVDKNKTNRKKKRLNSKPNGFNESLQFAKEILESKGISYFFWLHEKHREIILDFTLSNKKEITEIIKEDTNG